MIELHPNETIVAERRRFWLPIATEAALVFFAAITPITLITILADSLPLSAQLIISKYQISFLFLSMAWILVAWIIFAVSWTNYYLDVLLITDKRIVDIEQIGLFARDVAETRIENIQDVRAEVVGLAASLFNFGNLHIQTAGVNKEFVIRNIQNPTKVKDLISQQHDKLITNSKTLHGI